VIILRIDKHGHCPNCGVSWDAGPIPQKYIDQGFHKEGAHYSNLIGVQLVYPDPNSYDGVCLWKCPSCGQIWCRWCGAKLKAGESHPPFHGTNFEEAKTEVLEKYGTALRNLADS
jgi:hypothetical protein